MIADGGRTSFLDAQRLYALCAWAYRNIQPQLLFALQLFVQRESEFVSKLFVSVLTGVRDRPKFATHNKQGGCVGISFPTDLEKYMSARPISSQFTRFPVDK